MSAEQSVKRVYPRAAVKAGTASEGEAGYRVVSNAVPGDADDELGAGPTPEDAWRDAYVHIKETRAE